MSYMKQQLHELLESAYVAGKMAGLVAATEAIGGFIEMADNGRITDDWLIELRKLRDGMCDIALGLELDFDGRMNNASGS